MGSDAILCSSANSSGGGASLGKSAAGSSFPTRFALYSYVLQHQILLSDWSRGPHETFFYSCDEALEEEQYSARQIGTKQKCPAALLSSSSSAWYVSHQRHFTCILNNNFLIDADERKKKVYEQQENESNPLRCPVKLYEFYVSKW